MLSSTVQTYRFVVRPQICIEGNAAVRQRLENAKKVRMNNFSVTILRKRMIHLRQTLFSHLFHTGLAPRLFNLQFLQFKP